MMKYLFIKLCFLFLFSVPKFSLAQTSNTATTDIVISESNITLSEYSQIIKSQSGYNISYNPDEISPQFLLKFHSKKMSLHQSLSYLKKEYNISHKIKGNTIILIKKVKRKPILSSKTSSKNKNNSSNKNKNKPTQTSEDSKPPTVKPSSTFTKKKEEEFIPTEIKKTDRTQKRSFLFQQKKAEINSYNLGNTFNNWRHNNRSLDKYNLNIGVQFEETFYVNPFVEIGYKNWMLTGFYSLGVDGISHFRYGIKYDVTLSENSSLGLEFNYGTFEKPLHFSHVEHIPEDDSLGTLPTFEIYEYTFDTKNELYKGGLTYQYEISKKLDVKVGFYWNVLQVEIQNYNSEFAIKPYEMHPEILENITFHNFATAHPPFDFYNNFDIKKPNYTRMWLGAHIGLRYRFFR